ncbi:hypothetical protein DYE50_11795 [Treponema ruminis]|uniref:hypothetical protein n=1 Tax=Treponema ruminis TaxID=744515 RepID=UPI00197F5379|nr:hypothetical protein [Treponema ruminis]QSI03248.1 hypothetical protein DYE50_11795 [Treponema ruminis]
MRDATPERLDAFYTDFLSLLDRGINPFTMDGDEYFYLKSMHSPMRDGTSHPDLFANIQLNIMANKTGRAHFQPAEISRMDLFSIEEPLLEPSNHIPDIHRYDRPSKAESILVTAEYLELINACARCEENIILDSRSRRSFKSISDEYSDVIGSSLDLKERHDFYMMKHALTWLSRRHSLDVAPDPREPSNEEVAEYSVKYNIFNAILLADMTMKSIRVDFSKLKKAEEDAEELRKLTVIILAYSLLNDSCYFQDKPLPVMAVMSLYTRYFPEAFSKAEDLRKIFTEDFDFSLWYGIVHRAQLFSHLRDDGREQNPQREEIIKELEKIHSQDIRDKAFRFSPPKGQDDVPMISILNSFIPELKDGTVMTLPEAEKRFESIHQNLTKENVDHRHDARITFSISFDRDGTRETVTVPESSPMDLCRESGIPQHIAHLASLGVIEDPGLPAFLSKHLGLSLLEEKIEKEVIPAIEKEAERKDYTSYIRAHIKSSRRLLNKHHDIDITAPLGVKNYRTDKSVRTTRREKKEAPAPDDESKSNRRDNARSRTRQDKRKRRLR